MGSAVGRKVLARSVRVCLSAFFIFLVKSRFLLFFFYCERSSERYGGRSSWECVDVNCRQTETVGNALKCVCEFCFGDALNVGARLLTADSCHLFGD